MNYYIKNMVCDRCKMVVKSLLEELRYQPLSIGLGEIALKEELSEMQKTELSRRLTGLGFELISDKRSKLIEQIKTNIIEIIYNDKQIKNNLSDYLSDKLHHDYTFLSKSFSEVEGITIEKYFMAQKIERVKELLVYDEMNLSEIAFRLNYSSVAHLSTQFKKITGLTPSHFKQVKDKKRKSIDKI